MKMATLNLELKHISSVESSIKNAVNELDRRQSDYEGIIKDVNKIQSTSGNLSDCNIYLKKKNSQLQDKMDKFQNKIDEINTQKDELVDKCKGQSEEFIARERKKLDDKLDKLNEQMNTFVEEQKKKITDWLEEQKAKIQKAQEDAMKQMAEAEAPGFRKGKLPRGMFLKKFGDQRVHSKVMDELINESYREIVLKEKIDLAKVKNQEEIINKILYISKAAE